MTDERKEELVTKYAAWIARLYFRSPPVDVSYSESPARLREYPYTFITIHAICYFCKMWGEVDYYYFIKVEGKHVWVRPGCYCKKPWTVYWRGDPLEGLNAPATL